MARPKENMINCWARIRKALRVLDAPSRAKRSSGLAKLISDAKRGSGRKKSPANDVALLGTIERISHFGLAIYTTIDRHLQKAGAPDARRALASCIKKSGRHLAR
jgi:ferritin-like metal-binding protein YciE